MPGKDPSHWSNGLVRELTTSALRLISTENAVVIRDKYPKARNHYLVLPLADIPSIYDLDASHRDLLNEIELLATNAVELSGRPAADFQMGYHAEPSMQRLHLHVISRDFDSACLKTRHHWNSFNTEHFLPMLQVHEWVLMRGSIERPTAEHVERCMRRDLRCHRCKFVASNMPALKAHIVRPHPS